MIAVMFAALGVDTSVFLSVWAMALARVHAARPVGEMRPTLRHCGIGFVTNVFDTLGVGSFATTSAFFKLWRVVPDEQIPGTLNVGHTLPSVLQAFLYMTFVHVEMTTLMPMVGATILGAWLGAEVVAGWPRRKIQIGMGIALLLAATAMVMTQFSLFPPGGDSLGLGGVKLAVAVVGNFILAMLMMLGIGFYAPCMVMVCLLGMNPAAAFPIMMSSCAFMMPVGSIPFIRRQSYDIKAALGLAIGGLPGVLAVAILVKSLPLTAVRWLVIVVVIYAATMMLRSAVLEAQSRKATAATPDPAGIEIARSNKSVI